jgi:hypothetical protein
VRFEIDAQIPGYPLDKPPSPFLNVREPSRVPKSTVGHNDDLSSFWRDPFQPCERFFFRTSFDPSPCLLLDCLAQKGQSAPISWQREGELLKGPEIGPVAQNDDRTRWRRQLGQQRLAHAIALNLAVPKKAPHALDEKVGFVLRSVALPILAARTTRWVVRRLRR